MAMETMTQVVSNAMRDWRAVFVVMNGLRRVAFCTVVQTAGERQLLTTGANRRRWQCVTGAACCAVTTEMGLFEAATR